MNQVNSTNISFLVILLIILVIAFAFAFRYENGDTVVTDIYGISERG